MNVVSIARAESIVALSLLRVKPYHELLPYRKAKSDPGTKKHLNSEVQNLAKR